MSAAMAGAALIGTACSSSSDSATQADASADARTRATAGDADLSLPEFTPPSQSASPMCCADDTGCTCFAPYNVVCGLSADGLTCSCGPDSYQLFALRAPKCSPPPPITDGGTPGRCCQSPDKAPLGPQCSCTSAPCSPNEIEVTECAPATVARVCEGKSSKVDTCAGR